MNTPAEIRVPAQARTTSSAIRPRLERRRHIALARGRKVPDRILRRNICQVLDRTSPGATHGYVDNPPPLSFSAIHESCLSLSFVREYESAISAHSTNRLFLLLLIFDRYIVHACTTLQSSPKYTLAGRIHNSDNDSYGPGPGDYISHSVANNAPAFSLGAKLKVSHLM